MIEIVNEDGKTNNHLRLILVAHDIKLKLLELGFKTIITVNTDGDINLDISSVCINHLIRISYRRKVATYQVIHSSTSYQGTFTPYVDLIYWFKQTWVDLCNNNNLEGIL